MKLSLIGNDWSEAKLNFDVATYQALIVTLPGKQIKIDMQSGVVRDEQVESSEKLPTTNFVEAYERHQQREGLSISTINSNLSVLKALASRCPEWPPTSVDIEALLDEYELKSYSKVTLAEYWTRLKMWFTWAQKMGHIEVNPMNRVARRNMPVVEANVIHPEDFIKVIHMLQRVIETTVPSKPNLHYERAVRDLAIIRFAYSTGCRAGEISKLRLRDVSLAKQSAKIAAQHAKSKKERTVYFGDQAKSALNQWLDIRPAKGSQFFVSTCGNGWSAKPFGSAGIYISWQARQRAAGIGPYKFHEIRHSHVTHSLNKGVPLHHVSRQAGHSSPNTTLRVYSHSEDPERKQAYEDQNPDDDLDV